MSSRATPRGLQPSFSDLDKPLYTISVAAEILAFSAMPVLWRVLPFVTVFSKSADIDALVAPSEVVAGIVNDITKPSSMTRMAQRPAHGKFRKVASPKLTPA